MPDSDAAKANAYPRRRSGACGGAGAFHPISAFIEGESPETILASRQGRVMSARTSSARAFLPARERPVSRKPFTVDGERLHGGEGRRSTPPQSVGPKGRSPMKTRAAVAVAAGKPLEIMEVDLEGPREGEVLVEIKATGVCHTDDFTLSGPIPRGCFRPSSAMRARGSSSTSARGLRASRKGDHVIPLYTSECRQCPRVFRARPISARRSAPPRGKG